MLTDLSFYLFSYFFSYGAFEYIYIYIDICTSQVLKLLIKSLALLLFTGSDGKFTVDSNTGEIRTSPSPLNREEKSVYQMTAVATDTGDRQVFLSLHL